MDSLTKYTAGAETELRFLNKIYCLKFISDPVLTVTEHTLLLLPPLSPVTPVNVNKSHFSFLVMLIIIINITFYNRLAIFYSNGQFLN